MRKSSYLRIRRILKVTKELLILILLCLIIFSKF